MAGRMIGIEIGSDTIKMAVCTNGRVQQLASRRIRTGAVLDGKITSTDDMIAMIKDTMRTSGIHGVACALVLPPQIVIGRSITVPAMGHEEMMLNLSFEFKDYIGKDADKYLYDYAVKSVHDGSMEIYACAVLKEDIEYYYKLLRGAGLNMKIAIPAEMAWLNLIRQSDIEPKNLCIVDIGHNTTGIRIFADGGFAMGKQVELAGHALDEALGRYFAVDPYAARTRKEANLDNCLAIDACIDIYADIATEITRTLKFYNDTHASSRVSDIYYCGGSVAIEALRTAIVKSADMVPHHISRLLPGQFEKEELPLCCAIAVGAALQG